VAVKTTLVVVKGMNYRGDLDEEFSNAYSFKAAPPSGDEAWLTLANDLIAHEKPIFQAGAPFKRVYGYDSDDPNANSVFSHDFTLDASPPTATGSWAGHLFAGDQAACVQWRTSTKNTRGKWVYLRKYLHLGQTELAQPDTLFAGYKTSLETYAAAIQGFWGGLTARQAPLSVEEFNVMPWVTTRTLKRRGKRPPLPA